MNTEKLQLLATSCSPAQEEESILRIWNSPKLVRVAKRFPVVPFTDSTFLLYLHRYVFWSQLKTSALEQLPSLLKEVTCSGSTPSLSISQLLTQVKPDSGNTPFPSRLRTERLTSPWIGRVQRMFMERKLCVA